MPRDDRGLGGRDRLLEPGVFRVTLFEDFTVSPRQSSRRRRSFGRKRDCSPLLENLENRLVLSGTPRVNLNLMEFHDPSRIPAGVTPSPLGILPLGGGLPFPVGYEPADISTAYGIGNIKFGSVTGDGTGQTIAIVDTYDDPSFVNEYLSNGNLNPAFANSDLAQFDSQVGIADPPNFTKVNESGQTSPLPGTDPAGAGNVNGNWEIEEALDIEWAHGIAPGASIVLVEASTDQQRRPFQSGHDGCKSAGRLGRLHELGRERIQRRAVV